MATLVLSAAGAAAGGALGGSVLGLSMTAVGRFVGASLGRQLDQRLLGQGAEPVETGRIDRFRVSAAGEGARIPQVFGRMRVGGQVIWASRFQEVVTEQGGGGGKGAPRQPTVRSYSYRVSLALALCEGEITGVQRIWADGAELAISDLALRVYPGTEDQLPDPRIEAVEGAGQVPAYRGTAYVVIEDLSLEAFGNRIPQFSFEVTRPDLDDSAEVPLAVRGVAMIPGTGEYAYATQPVSLGEGLSGQLAGGGVANVNGASRQPDFNASLDQLGEELPNCGAASLIASWFGNDLRCGACEIRPKVEQADVDSTDMPWSVSGVTRSGAQEVPQVEGRPVYGGTPCDASVIQAIRRMRDQGLDVMVYPFILMEQLAGNGRPDPWSGAPDQPVLPWRGRITTSVAPTQAGSPDGTSDADSQVAAFFGSASASDFTINGDTVSYSGPAEWRYRRFILHQAALCAAAGGVESFCIGSEMRALTQIRGASGFPAVQALRALAAECRAILGPAVQIGYAADWSEYFGYQPQDGSGDRYFHLDPLWADPEIDFIGIDNYMPLSDWRDGDSHADAEWGTVYDLEYLRAGIEGGEGYDWYYASDADRAAQIRSAISDGGYGEPWVWRYKDIRNWWDNAHHDRIGGMRQAAATAWVPRSKPVRFTELGCAAIDKGTNQPNKFLDPKSSESDLPYYSTGVRDDLIQRQYLRAMLGYWSEAANNPTSEVYGAPMLDMAHAYVWAWDARPYPWFPGNEDLWSDGPNYRRGHWLNGRVGARSLASVVREICADAGLTEIDTSELFGVVRGYAVTRSGDARAALQPLMLAYGFDAVERDGMLVFRSRVSQRPQALTAETLIAGDADTAPLSLTRASEASLAGRVRLGFVLADADHQVVAEEARLPQARSDTLSDSEVPLVLTREEGRQTAERWLTEARVARETLRFALPPSASAVGAGDVITLPTAQGTVRARIDRVESTTTQEIEATCIDPEVYLPAALADERSALRAAAQTGPVASVFLDLPLLRGDEDPDAPHVAATAARWPGPVAVYGSDDDSAYRLSHLIETQAIMGLTETALSAAAPGRADLGAPLRIRLVQGALESVSDARLLAGANAMAIGDGQGGPWEVFQFRDAELVAPGVWDLSHRLRGQAGTDGIMPEVWPVGATVVLLTGAVGQIDLAPQARGVARHYRIGPAARPYDDAFYRHEMLTFEGVSRRPYSPAHLTLTRTGGDLTATWIRRSRIDGDSWSGLDVPLGEDREAYLVQLRQGGTVLREEVTGSPEWVYTAAQIAQDGASGPVEVAVAQVSDRFGAGPFKVASITI